MLYFSSFTCKNLRIYSYYAGIFCLLSSIIIIQLISMTYCASKSESIKYFKTMVCINGIFPFIYGTIQFSLLVLVGIAYNMEE